MIYTIAFTGKAHGSTDVISYHRMTVTAGSMPEAIALISASYDQVGGIALVNRARA